MLAAAEGDTDAALDELAVAVAGHGRIIGRGALLVTILGDRPPAELADRLRTVGAPHLSQIADEMRAAGGAGPAVAELLATRP